MKSDKPNQSNVEYIFQCALDLDKPQRPVFLDGACLGDASLRQRVDALLAAHEEAEGFLPAGPTTDLATQISTPLTEGAGTLIERYKLLEKLGEGGFGVVWAAEQREPVRRRVALKIIKLGMDSKQVVARFEAERQALALMDHPNIAKVLDAGTTETGRPFFVMELVKGIPITKYCDQAKLGTQARLDLFIKVCHAIQHAHQKGIIHRDIKPSNIMVTLHDGVPVPKVIDFGIAKATQQELTEQTVYTQYSQFIGTPAYMSPEQAEMSGLDIDTRSDIYSLGVLLYELITGSTPFDTKELMASGIDEMRKIIREQEPERPSTRLSQTLQASQAGNLPNKKSAIQKPKPEIDSDLDWIVMKALEKDRSRRYDTANGLAMDLKRHLTHEPVVARPPSAVYKFQKAWRRNKLVYSAGCTVAVSLVIGLASSLWMTLKATHAEKVAHAAKEDARAAQGKATNALDQALRATVNLQKRAYVADIGLAHKAIQEGNLGRAQELLGKHPSPLAEEDLRGFEWRFLWARSQGDYADDLGEYIGHLSGLSISPDSQFVALNRSDPSRVEIIHLASGEVAKSFAMTEAVVPLTYSTSGNVLLGSHQGKIVAWDTKTWKPREPLPLSFPLAFGHNTNDEMFVARDGDHLSVWNAANWQIIGDLPNSTSANQLIDPSMGGEEHMVDALAISSNDRIAYLAGKTRIRRWDLNSLTELPPFKIKDTLRLATSDNGKLAAADRFGGVHMIAEKTGEVHTFNSHIGWVSGLKFAEDGSHLVSTGADRKLIVYDPVKQSIATRLLGHRSEIMGVDISADGTTIVSGGAREGRILRWSLTQRARKNADLEGVKRSAILKDDRILIYRDSTDDLEYYDPVQKTFEPAQTKRIVQTLNETGAEPVGFSPNAKWVLSQEGDALVVWNVFTGSRVQTLDQDFGKISNAVFSPDSGFLVTKAGSPESEVRLWRTSNWKSEVLCKNVPTVHAVDFSDDSKRIAIVGDSAFVSVFDLESVPRKITLEVEENTGAFFAAEFSGSGRLLAIGTIDNCVLVYDLQTNKWLTLKGHIQGVFSLSFSPDDKTLVSSCGSMVRFWNVATWEEMMSIADDDYSTSLRFSQDGQYLAAEGGRHNMEERVGLHIWQAPTLDEIDRRSGKNSAP